MLYLWTTTDILSKIPSIQFEKYYKCIICTYTYILYIWYKQVEIQELL